MICTGQTPLSIEYGYFTAERLKIEALNLPIPLQRFKPDTYMTLDDVAIEVLKTTYRVAALL